MLTEISVLPESERRKPSPFMGGMNALRTSFIHLGSLNTASTPIAFRILLTSSRPQLETRPTPKPISFEPRDGLANHWLANSRSQHEQYYLASSCMLELDSLGYSWWCNRLMLWRTWDRWCVRHHRACNHSNKCGKNRSKLEIFLWVSKSHLNNRCRLYLHPTA